MPPSSLATLRHQTTGGRRSAPEDPPFSRGADSQAEGAARQAAMLGEPCCFASALRDLCPRAHVLLESQVPLAAIPPGMATDPQQELYRCVS